MNSGNIFRSFSSSRRQFLKQSAALAAAVGVAPAALSAGAGSANAATGSAYANELWEKTKAELAGMSDIPWTSTCTRGGLHRGAGARPLQPPDRGERQPADADLGPRGREQPARRRNLDLDVINLNNSWQRNPAFPRGTDRAPRQGQVRAALRHERGGLRVALSLGARRERRAPARHAPALWPRRPGGQYRSGRSADDGERRLHGDDRGAPRASTASSTTRTG